ncbi:hypothetical protein Efla_004453 [Eimeria flavescens]
MRTTSTEAARLPPVGKNCTDGAREDFACKPRGREPVGARERQCPSQEQLGQRLPLFSRSWTIPPGRFLPLFALNFFSDSKSRAKEVLFTRSRCSQKAAAAVAPPLVRSAPRGTMGRWKPVGFFLLFLSLLLAFHGADVGICGSPLQLEADVVDVEVAAEAGPAAVEPSPFGQEDDEADGDEEGAGQASDSRYQESVEPAEIRPQGDRPRTTKRLYTTRRTNKAGAGRGNQQVKLKLLGLGMVLLVAIVAVALKGKGFLAEDDEEDGDGEGEGEKEGEAEGANNS